MTKKILFCADGTWNAPDENEDDDKVPDPTNVYKLFLQLTGTVAQLGVDPNVEQEKTYVDPANTDQVLAVAKYLHGVGDSKNPITKLLGGAFGAGIVSRIVRGYTFISRNFSKGDEIILIGFSRGAYTARALGGMIASQGLLQNCPTDKEAAYRMGAKVWYRWRDSIKKPNIAASLVDALGDLPAFLTRNKITQQDLLAPVPIKAIAVWDTVGSLGIPEYNLKLQANDAFQFADTKLSDAVDFGFHAVSLDEQRNAFVPTLWEDDPARIEQRLFPGAHCDVGGGYPAKDNQSGLSDGALQWMMDKLKGLGVIFSSDGAYPIKPDPTGVAHQPWEEIGWKILGSGLRSFNATMKQDGSISARMNHKSGVQAAPNGKLTPYKPKNLKPPYLK